MSFNRQSLSEGMGCVCGMCVCVCVCVCVRACVCVCQGAEALYAMDLKEMHTFSDAIFAQARTASLRAFFKCLICP
jgi:hypothetical protein